MTALLGAQRRERMLAALERDGAIRLEAIAEELGVSVMTVRRDLADLEADGRVRRVRGGAVAPLLPQPFEARRASRGSQKATIARKAAALVPHTGAIAVDASSTSGILLSLLPATGDLLVATNSVENAATARRPGVRSVLIGGELEERTGSFVGALAERAAASLSYTRFFGSCAAVDARGSSEVTPEEAEMKAVFAAAAAETVLLVDSSKLDDRALASALDWSAIHVLVTELDPADHRLDAYRALVELL
jgi:DeoR family glycerol-3-phosphate regulon repressor